MEAAMADRPQTDKEKMDKKLDEALRDSFPSSDPVAITEPAPAPKKEPVKKH
jgi:hypothetical protein